VAQSAKEAAAAAGHAVTGAGRVLACRCARDMCVVASSSTANVVDASLAKLALAGGLAFELVIKGEGCFLRGWVNVACSAAAAGELGRALR